MLLTWHVHQTEEFYESESENEQFGLLEIKCPQATSFVEVPYLSEQDKLHLKPTHTVYVSLPNSRTNGDLLVQSGVILWYSVRMIITLNE